MRPFFTQLKSRFALRRHANFTTLSPFVTDRRNGATPSRSCDLAQADERRQKMTSEIEIGSTNVYADLGYADAAEMQRKATLAAEIARGIQARHLTQDAAMQLLGIDQAKVSKITRGQFRGGSETKLLELVARLGH
jgi:predicted XRE-type DNA-binding protein